MGPFLGETSNCSAILGVKGWCRREGIEGVAWEVKEDLSMQVHLTAKGRFALINGLGTDGLPSSDPRGSVVVQHKKIGSVDVL
jgi:hypothetical protein